MSDGRYEAGRDLSPDAAVDFATFVDLVTLYQAYASALDARQYERWPEFFIDDCVYRLQPRENFDRGLPLALMALESRGMMKDRVYGVTQTI